MGLVSENCPLKIEMRADSQWERERERDSVCFCQVVTWKYALQKMCAGWEEGWI